MIRRHYHVHCAVEGCSTRLNAGQLFCKEHYHSLPKALKDRLWATWRAAMNARRGTTPHAEQLAANREYQRAYQDCSNYLSAAPKTPAEAMTAVGIAADGERVRFTEGRRL